MTQEILIISNRSPMDDLFPGSLRNLLTNLQTTELHTARKLLTEHRPENIIIDVDSLNKLDIDAYQQFKNAMQDIDLQADCILLGKADHLAGNGEIHLTLPTTADEILAAIRRQDGQLLPPHTATPLLLPDSGTGYPTMNKTCSDVMCEVLDKVALVADTDTTVLLIGETGTGKGVVARLIHDSSKRNSETMLSVHCGAIPESLIESELFGHEKGSFTGAIKTKKGKFEQASKGTIFLDEIGTITAATQIKLLQVLQDRTFQPIGSTRTHTTDVRIVAATNSDLGEMANRGEFRTDLYYRLNVFPIEIPPLRQRKEDIPLFVSYFLEQFNTKHNKKIIGLTGEVIDAFQQYRWPGNVRELENLLERACILADTALLGRTLFPPDMFRASRPEPMDTLEPHNVKTLAETRNEAINKAEIDYLCTVLSMHNGRIEATAKTAGVSRRQIHKLLTKHNIQKEHFKNSRHIKKETGNLDQSSP